MPSRLDLQRGTSSHGRNCASRGGWPLIEVRHHGSNTVPKAACYVAEIRFAWIGATTFVGSNSVPLPASFQCGLGSFSGPLQESGVVHNCRVVRDESPHGLGVRPREFGADSLPVGANVSTISLLRMAGDMPHERISLEVEFPPKPLTRASRARSQLPRHDAAAAPIRFRPARLGAAVAARGPIKIHPRLRHQIWASD